MMLVLLIVAAIGAFLAYVGTRPDTFAVARSVDIAATPDRVFPILNDFKAWPDWSPYEKIDPAMQRTLGAVTQGEGATYAWSGNGKVGAGNMLITKSVPSSLVALDLNMLKPMRASNKVTFSLMPKGNLTMVTWEMAGKSPFFAKLMGVVMNMDKIVGTQFEEGLANLKRLTETDV